MANPSLPNIVIVGSSGHAKVIIDIVEKAGAFRIVGLIDAHKPAGETAFGYSVLGAEDALPSLVEQHDLAGGLIAVGDNWTRHLVAGRIGARLPDFPFVTAVHPSAQIARGVTIGAGSVVMAGAIVNSDSAIGAFCILNTNASLDHDGVMADFSSLAPAATTGGNVRIGAFSAVSIGATVVHGRVIGAHSVVGAGSVVLKDVPDLAVVYGVPARVVRTRTEGERYL